LSEPYHTQSFTRRSFFFVSLLALHPPSSCHPKMQPPTKAVSFSFYRIWTVEYARDTGFAPERLASITGEEVLQWLNLCCFDNPTPPKDANPVKFRSNTVAYAKKAISPFLPNRNIPWNELTLTGNPTQYYKITDMIKSVLAKEVWGQGRKSQARRALTPIALHANRTVWHSRTSEFSVCDDCSCQ
jgi:hypothetical protein